MQDTETRFLKTLIENLRSELNKYYGSSILSPEVIYELSIQLDVLIVEYIRLYNKQTSSKTAS